MEYMLDKEHCTRKWLKKKGFYQSSEDENLFEYHFLVYTCGETIKIVCNVKVDISTGRVDLSVVDKVSRSLFAPWYQTSNRRWKMRELNIINKHISQKLNWCDIHPVASQKRTA